VTALFALVCALAAAPRQADIVVYGATSGGLAAAIQASRMGKSVLVLDPGTHIGGLATGGLSWTDIARECYQRIKAKYDNAAAWKWQRIAPPGYSKQPFTSRIT
jgi:flavin-dependent dehydrogenase